jgi:hypothetical protein
LGFASEKTKIIKETEHWFFAHMSTVRTALACQQGINTNFICTENGKQATVIKQCSLIAEATKSLIQCNVTVMKEMNSQAIASVAKAASNQPGVRTMLV